MRHQAIYNTHPNVKSIDDGAGAFDKDGNSVTIDETKVAEEVKRLQAEYDAQEYARNRAAAFPSWQEQLDMQYHDAKNGTTTWQDAIEAVKTKYPKGE